MSDEVDDLLRRAMTALDRQVPDGYFDTLPNRTLARLEDPGFDEPHAADPLPASSAPGLVAVAPSDPEALAAATDPVLPRSGPRARGSRRQVLAIAGLGLAAAAGAVVFVSTHDRAMSAPEAADAFHERAELVRLNRARPGGGAANGASAGAGSAATSVETIVPAVDSSTGAARADKTPLPATQGGGKAAVGYEPDALEPKQAKGKIGSVSLSGKPAKSVGKPRPDGASLTPDDLQRGMAAVAGAARACFAGAKGSATVRLTVAPSGRVQEVTATGLLAGTPVGACVERAAKAATFPPRGGEAERFTYEFSTSE